MSKALHERIKELEQTCIVAGVKLEDATKRLYDYDERIKNFQKAVIRFTNDEEWLTGQVRDRDEQIEKQDKEIIALQRTLLYTLEKIKMTIEGE